MPDNLPKPKPSLRDKQAQYDNKKVKKHSKKQARSKHLPCRQPNLRPPYRYPYYLYKV